MQNEQEGPVYWFDQYDIDIYGDFYLRVRREQLRRYEDSAYAAFGRYIAGEIRQKTENRDLRYIRYNSFSTHAERICARAVIEWEVFNGPVGPDTERAVREGVLL